jgi:hypothetical protein
VVASLNSFRAHFRKAARFIVNAAVPSQWSDAFTEVNRSDPQQQRDLKVVDAVAAKASKGEMVHSQVILAVDTGSRLLAKIALALGYKLLGGDFLTTPYAADLRKALWERDFSARQQIPIRGSGYLHGEDPLGAVTYPHGMARRLGPPRQGLRRQARMFGVHAVRQGHGDHDLRRCEPGCQAAG